MRKLLAMVLALMLTLGCVSALADYNDHTDYVDWPIVEDGSVTVTVLSRRNETDGIDADKMWFWNWSEKFTGIDFEVEQVLASAGDERKSLLLASGDLPDLLWDLPLTDAELVRYGMGEDLFLDLTPYFTPEIMPYLCAWDEVHPEGLAYATTPDGKIYSFPAYVDLYILSEPGVEMGVNNKYLSEAGYAYGQIPETLEDFVAYLYKIKERHPDLYPLAGSYEYDNPMSPLMNAFGFVWAQSGTAAGNGLGLYGAEMFTGDEKEFVLPVMTERFKELVELMHQFYADGIIDPEFYTIGQTQVLANYEAEKYAAAGGGNWQHLTDADLYHRWSFLKPLTSEYANTPRTGTALKFKHGGVLLNADIEPEKAEAICRWIDFFYSDLGGMYIWCGPAATSSDTIDMIGGYTADETGAAHWYDKDGNETGSSPFMRGHAGGASGNSQLIGNRSNPLEGSEAFELGVTNRPEMRNWFYDKSLVPYGYDPNWGNGWAMRSLKTQMEPYRIDSTPHVVYFDEDTTLAVDDLHLVLDKAVESELAKFVTGKRDLAEWDAFQSELKAMGIEELFGYYKDAYDSYQAAKGE